MLGGRWESTLVEPGGQGAAPALPQMPCRVVPGGSRVRCAAAAVLAGAAQASWLAGEYRCRQTAPHGRHGPPTMLQPATSADAGCHTRRHLKSVAQVATAPPPVALQSRDEAMWWQRRRGGGTVPRVALLPPPSCSHLQRHLAGRAHSLTLPATVLLFQPLLQSNQI